MQKILGLLTASAALLAAGPGVATAAQTRGSDPARASLIVNVPEDARVYLQDQQMRSEGPVRHYISPPLQTGARYTYTVRIEVERDGRVLSETVRVPVQAGQRVDLNARLGENAAGELALNVASPAGAAAAGTYRSFSFEPGAGSAPAFQPPAFQPPSYYQAPAYPQTTTRGSQPAGSRIEQRLRPGSGWRR